MVLGAVPLAMSVGAGAESRIQIGWVIVGGLAFGTLLTLYVVPTMYTLMEQWLGKWMGSHHHRDDAAGGRAAAAPGPSSDDAAGCTRHRDHRSRGQGRPPHHRGRCDRDRGRRITERRFHHYVNPERDSDEGALAVHGLTRHFLEDKPKFAEIADDLLAFVKDAEVIIHNAAFDLEFLDAELARIGRGRFAAALREGDGFAAARARAASGQAQFARCAVRALPGLQRASHAARRAARRRPAGRGVSGDDARPGQPDDRRAGRR